MKIGLSLSICIRDIAAGVVQEADVSAIITNTCAPDEERWGRLLASYSRSYWRDHASASTIATRMWKAGRIVQPRIDNPDYQHYSVPHWVDVASQAFGSGDPRKPVASSRTSE